MQLLSTSPLNISAVHQFTPALWLLNTVGKHQWTHWVLGQLEKPDGPELVAGSWKHLEGGKLDLDSVKLQTGFPLWWWLVVVY